MRPNHEHHYLLILYFFLVRLVRFFFFLTFSVRNHHQHQLCSFFITLLLLLALLSYGSCWFCWLVSLLFAVAASFLRLKIIIPTAPPSGYLSSPNIYLAVTIVFFMLCFSFGFSCGCVLQLRFFIFAKWRTTYVLLFSLIHAARFIFAATVCLGCCCCWCSGERPM